MPVTINGDGSITGLSVGGLPNGTVDADTLASNAVTTNKIANSAVTSVKTSGVGGLTMVNSWNCSSGFNYQSTTDITSWSEDTSGKIGTGMSESSGIFTFPSTGIYRVRFSQSTYNIGSAEVRYIGAFIRLSTNSGGSYSTLREQYDHINNDTSCTTTVVTSNYLNVTNISTTRIKFSVAAELNSTLNGGYYGTYVEFMKFGD